MKMAPPMAPLLRPWNKSFILAGFLVFIGLFLTASRFSGRGVLTRTFHDLPSGKSGGSVITTQPATEDVVVPDSHAKRKAIITAVQRKDERTADWILDQLPGWEPVVYVTDRTADDPAPTVNVSRIHTLPMAVNFGREASVYLTYIIEHYDDLPDYMVFVHGKRYQIHNDDPMLDTAPEIRNLNLAYVDDEGYTSLRCNWMHCPKPQVEPVLGYKDAFWDVKGLYADAWVEFFPNEPVPPQVSGPCCAQFAVNRAAVRRWPLEQYKRIRHWIYYPPKGEELTMKVGIVLEYMWHVIFGKPPVFCPPARECYCKKWGLCDLECENEGWCLGRVWVNPHKNPPLGTLPQVPPGWPEEGQTGGALPYEGWWNDPEVVKNH